jgi:hypothetical protein
MGLLLLERETWTPQVEELKDALAESEMQASIQVKFQLNVVNVMSIKCGVIWRLELTGAH